MITNTYANANANVNPLTDGQVRSAINSVVKSAEDQASVVANEQEILIAHFDLIHSLNNAQTNPATIQRIVNHIEYLTNKRIHLLRQTQASVFSLV